MKRALAPRSALSLSWGAILLFAAPLAAAPPIYSPELDQTALPTVAAVSTATKSVIIVQNVAANQQTAGPLGERQCEVRLVHTARGGSRDVDGKMHNVSHKIRATSDCNLPMSRIFVAARLYQGSPWLGVVASAPGIACGVETGLDCVSLTTAASYKCSTCTGRWWAYSTHEFTLPVGAELLDEDDDCYVYEFDKVRCLLVTNGVKL